MQFQRQNKNRINEFNSLEYYAIYGCESMVYREIECVRTINSFCINNKLQCETLSSIYCKSTLLPVK